MPKSMDVNPQWMSMSVTETAANTFTQSSENAPTVQDIGNGKALVMEILKARVDIQDPDSVDGKTNLVSLQLTSQSKSDTVSATDADLIVRQAITALNQTETTDDKVIFPPRRRVETIDLTDGAGHGVLFAGKTLFLGIKGSENSAAKSGNIRLLYRLKEVGAVELLGILQQ